MNVTSPCPRPAYRALIVAATVAGGLLLTACGGGGGGSSSPAVTPSPPPPAPTPSPAVAETQVNATDDVANGTQSGAVASAVLDTVYDATLVIASRATSPSSTDRSNAQRVSPQDGVVTLTAHDLPCPGGGTVTVQIGGNSLVGEENGVFDAGETYTLTYTGCIGRTGLAQLDGQALLTVNSVGTTATPVTAVTIALTNLTATLPQGSVVANGTASVSRSSLTAASVTTTTSAITTTGTNSIALATSFNSRSGTYTLTSLAASHVVTYDATAITGMQFSGSYSVTGSANSARSFTVTSSTASSTYDGTGTPTAGDWTVVNSEASLHAVLASGTVTLTVDEGADGTTDATYTFPVADLIAAAG